MCVEAFVVNASVREAGTYVRTQMNYAGMLTKLANGQQPPSDGDPFQQDGVYLKWRLPSAFTRGQHDPATGVTTFPPVPNRWLVVRYNGTSAEPTARTATAWIVVSDAISTSPQNSSVYIVSGQEQFIGMNVLLNGSSWTETGDTLHLTAVAPGNHAFAAYQPACNNVFSFIDAPGEQPDQTMSYMVAGWFSDAADDPLSPATSETFNELIANLGWTVGDTAWYANSTLVYGFVDGVTWTTANVTSSVPAQSGLTAVVANTSVEALTTLITAQGGEADEPDLLEALQLDLLENLDQPDGPALLQQKLQASFFKRYSGGYTWTIVGAPGAPPPSAHELEKERFILSALEREQKKLDDDLRQLAALQAQLYVMWWKWQWSLQTNPFDPGPGFICPLTLEAQLDPSTKGTLAWEVNRLRHQVGRTAVPQGNTATELQQSIARYAALHGLPETRLLKRAGAPPFYEINNPVVLISGAGATGIARTPSSVACRFPFDLINGFAYDGTPFPNADVPSAPLSSVNGAPAWWLSTVKSLQTEFFLLDPSNAAIIAGAVGADEPTVRKMIAGGQGYTGTLPDPVTLQQQTWGPNNPWRPLYLYWQASYYPIAYEGNWTFQNGSYAWNGTGLDPNQSDALTLNGWIILAPTAALNMQARITAFINNNSNNPHLAPLCQQLNTLLTFVDNKDGNWDLLSQTLDGFNQQLLLGEPGSFLSPSAAQAQPTPPINPSLTTLLGGVGSYPPDITWVPKAAPSSTNFQQMRSGQLVLTNLQIVDEWGQSVTVFDTGSDGTVTLPGEFETTMTSNEAYVFVYQGDDAPSSTLPVSPIENQTLQIESVSPASAPAGEQFQLTINAAEAGFPAGATVVWNGQPLPTTPSSGGSQLQATVPADAVGPNPVLVTAPGPTPPSGVNALMLPPALLQPARLDFSLDPAEPVSGWVVPNHLDRSLLAFDAKGVALGELSIVIDISNQPAVYWNNAPFSPYASLDAIPAPFGSFLQALDNLTAAEFATVLQAIDDTLWTTLPSSAAFDNNLAVLIGRPLALVQAKLQFLLDGPPVADPSWQYTFSPAPTPITGYSFDIQLGDVQSLEDGLIGYFTGGVYSKFNVVQQTAAMPDSFLQPIGVGGNYITQQTFASTSVTDVSMLVDPRGAVHATTGILPSASVSVPLAAVSAALEKMKVTFRMNGLLTDQLLTTNGQTIQMPLPHVHDAKWTWLEYDSDGWQPYTTQWNDANARLAPVAPMLRNGLLQLDEGIGS